MTFQIIDRNEETNVEEWQRRSRTEGAYVFKEGQNVEDYFKATGHSDLIKYMTQYKIHIGRKDDLFLISECFGDYGYFPNKLKMGYEAPFFHPGDKKGKPILKHALF